MAGNVISVYERDGGSIETLAGPNGDIYYRSCVGSTCRYSFDLWQAEIYLDQMLAQEFS